MTNFNAPNQTPQPQMLTVVLLSDIALADNYPIPANTSTIFMNYAMTELRMKARDSSGIPVPDRTWSIKETTPKQTVISGDYATKAEVNAISEKLDKLIEMMK